MLIDGEVLVFSTGKRIYANRGIIGLSEEIISDEYDLFAEGYDGMVYRNYTSVDGERVSTLTNEEKIELAEYMIGLWTKFLEQVAS